MPRSIIIGNGSALVGYDATFTVRDIYFPRVGSPNQTQGNACRTGVWVDGRFAWLDGPGWTRELGYEKDALVASAELRNDSLGLVLSFRDCVDMARSYLLRSLSVESSGGFADCRVFFHYDWYIGGSDIGNTVLYDPRHRAVIAYREAAYFLVGGRAGAEHGLDGWACGKKGGQQQGTWVDAEDGVLGGNPIEQGSVDCTVGFHLGGAGAGTAASMTHWVCMGQRLQDVSRYGQDLLVSRGEQAYLSRTRNYWTVWSDKGRSRVEDELGGALGELYRRSVLTARTHADSGGGIIAATDFDITKFARDTYAYVWPRDGALVANALDRAGHEDVTRRFFLFARDTLPPEGYFLHKYTPDGHIGSSWHPWVDTAGDRVLPVQEDETGLVVWALWEHYLIHRNLDFVVDLYSSLVVPAADWMASYTDDATGLPQESWDLWEERRGVHAFTVGAVHGGLRAARRFAELFGDGPAAQRYASAMESLRAACDRHLWRPELGRFARRVNLEGSGVRSDAVIDSAIHGLWRFGMYGPTEPAVVQTMQAIERELTVRAETGGLARYANDYYFQVDHDLASVPGNPWFICTLWLAQWKIATAQRAADLQPARSILEWTLAHQMPGGLLPEQLDPHSGAPLSVSPLAWSHAELVVTLDDYVRRAADLRAGVSPATRA